MMAARRAGAQGIKILCAGRIGGAEIARREKYMEGRVPLHTLRADIDYAQSTAHTTYGTIGVKVWVCNGEILDARSIMQGDLASSQTKQAEKPRTSASIEGRPRSPRRRPGPREGVRARE